MRNIYENRNKQTKLRGGERHLEKDKKSAKVCNL